MISPSVYFSESSFLSSSIAERSLKVSTPPMICPRSSFNTAVLMLMGTFCPPFFRMVAGRLMISFFVLRVSLRAHRDWQISALKTSKQYRPTASLLENPVISLSSFIHKSNLAVIVCGENTIGNTVENDIEKPIGLSFFHTRDHTIGLLKLKCSTIITVRFVNWHLNLPYS